LELNVTELNLANAGDFEDQFVDAIDKIRDVFDKSDNFEQTGKGRLNFEVAAKLKLSVDASTGQAFIESQMTTKLPKRKARLQSGKLHDGKMLVEVEPLPEQTAIKFVNKKGA